MGHVETARLLRPYARPFVRNAWYCAAWSDEVTTEIFPRRILNQPLMMYRRESTGEAVALLDVCPHKLAPMHLGERVGDDVVRCGYHGLEFDGTGECVRNPQGNGRIPDAARLRSFPLVERHGALWVWMGDPAGADPAKLSDFSHIDDAGRRTVKGGHHVDANYMVLVENLLDLGHGMFLHRQTGGVNESPLADARIEQDEEEIRDMRMYHAQPAPYLFKPYVNSTETVDFWTDIRWTAPSTLLNDVGCSPAGRGRDRNGMSMLGSHFLTPETQNTMHYFYAHSRNYAHDDLQLDESVRSWHRNALKAEDSRVAEAINEMIPQAMDLDVRMVMLSTDQSGMRANRILDRLVEAEA